MSTWLIVIGLLAVLLLSGALPLGSLTTVGPGIACDMQNSNQCLSVEGGYQDILQGGTYAQTQFENGQRVPVFVPSQTIINTAASTCNIQRTAHLGWDCNGDATVIQYGVLRTADFGGGKVVVCDVPGFRSVGANFGCSFGSWAANRDVSDGLSVVGRATINFNVVERFALENPVDTPLPVLTPEPSPQPMQLSFFDTVINFFRGIINMVLGVFGGSI